MIGRVAVSGRDVPLAVVSLDVTTRHARTSIDDGAQASTCTITAYNVTRATLDDYVVGRPLVIELENGTPRFTGTISDARLETPTPYGGATLHVVAVGNLARLGRLYTGDKAMPAELASERVDRVLTASGVPFVIQSSADNSDDYILAARDPGVVTVLDLLGEVANATAGAVADLPDGRVVFQFLNYRKDSPAWSLPSDRVLFAPDWGQTDDVQNRVSVTYAGGVVVREDPTSIDTFGVRAAVVTEPLAREQDAADLAAGLLVRKAVPRWRIPDADVLPDENGDPLDIRVGDLVDLVDLPADAPRSTMTAIVEGWTERDTPTGIVATLALSDALSSFAGLAWEDIPNPDAAYLWNTIDQSTTFAEALTLSDLRA